MITTVKQLTGMNINALRTVGVAYRLGETVAEFTSSPAEALCAVDKAISDTAPGTTRRSLAAVRRKLQAATTAHRLLPSALKAGRHNLTPYVTVTVV